MKTSSHRACTTHIIADINPIQVYRKGVNTFSKTETSEYNLKDMC